MSRHSGVRNGRQPGTMGRPVTVTTNSFPVTTIPRDSFNHYDALDKPYKRERALEIVEKLQLQNPQVFNPRAAYDGKKNMFRSRPLDLPGGSATFTVYMGGNPEQARQRGAKGKLVKITRVTSVNPMSILPVLSGQRAHSSDSLMTINILNVLVRMQPIMTHPSNARAFFTKDVRDLDIGMGLELWRGFFQSVRPSMDRLTINVDIATAVMYQGGPLISLVKAFLRVRDNRELRPSRIGDRHHRRLESFLKSLMVYPTVPKQTPGRLRRLNPIRSVVMKGSDEYRFEVQSQHPNEYPEELTITEYFKKTHRYKVALGDIICVRVSERAIYPIEVLEVMEGQMFKKKLPPALAARALKFATQKPHDRLKAIEKSGRIFGYADSDYLRQAGMTIETRPMMIPARVLPPPTIMFGQQRSTVPTDGAWNVLNKKLFNPQSVPAWAVICFEPSLDIRAVTTFVQKQMEACQELGMRFPRTKPPILPGRPQGNYQDYSKQLENAGLMAKNTFEPETKATHPTFILVILPDSAIDIKRAVKHWGDCIRGCSTQCMKAGKLPGANNQYHNNLALKINAKIGGVNSVPAANVEAMKWFADIPTMVIGADVSHAGPNSQRPSVTGLVSSVDVEVSRYVASTGIQESRLEIIDDLESMVKHAVMKFNEYHKMVNNRDVYPRRVLFYRDGVSEGQFDAVAKQEVAKVKHVLAQMPRSSNSPPCKLTFIIVGKRHHQRFFPKQGEGDRSGNCPAGLVVDQGIVNPVVYDFYLQSHGGLLGTSRPAHYSVIEDENGLGSDPLQELSFTLCHVYTRATRSVSIPAPVYYADLVCSRGDFHSTLLHTDLDDFSNLSPEASLNEHRQMFRRLASNMAQTMYFA